MDFTRLGRHRKSHLAQSPSPWAKERRGDSAGRRAQDQVAEIGNEPGVAALVIGGVSPEHFVNRQEWGIE
jgi:hypothetical protein